MTAPLRLTHGTLEVTDIHAAIAFYREFLGLEVIHHMPKGCRVSLGGDFYIICVEVPHAHDMPLLNHFGLDCASRNEVDAWHARALAERERWGLTKITHPAAPHGAYAFFLKDRDGNWWEIQHYEGDAKAAHLAWGEQQFGRRAAAGAAPDRAG